MVENYPVKVRGAGSNPVSRVIYLIKGYSLMVKYMICNHGI